MALDWCPTCEERCSDHPSVCTVCGDALQTRPATTAANTSTSSNTQDQIQRMLEEAVRAAGGGADRLPLAANLANIAQTQQTTPLGVGGVGGDMWETPPPEALDPNAANANKSSRPTSQQCIDRIPRLKVEEHSAVLHEASLTIVLPPPLKDSIKRPPPLLFDAMVAEFGPVPPYQITGCQLVLANPITGATPSSSNTNTTNNKEGIFYMERGGGITFASKALHAQQNLNAKALLIGNNVPVWPYIMRDSKHESKHKLHIPVVMLKRSDGRRIRSLLERHAGEGTVTASLTAKKCSSGSSKDGGSCVVCRDVFDVGDTVIRLPFCAHVFHEQCALMWLKKHNTCPYCRRELPTDDEEYERERRRVNRTHGGGGGGSEDGLDSNQWESLFG